jgi:hypothetical protein
MEILHPLSASPLPLLPLPRFLVVWPPIRKVSDKPCEGLVKEFLTLSQFDDGIQRQFHMN